MIAIQIGKDLLDHLILTLASENFASNMQDEVPAPSLGRLVSTIQPAHTANTFSLAFNLQSTSLFFLISLSQIKCLLFLIFFFEFQSTDKPFPLFFLKYSRLFHWFFPRILSWFAHSFYSLHNSVTLFDTKIMKAPNFPAWSISLTGMHAMELSRELMFSWVSFPQYIAPIFQKFWEKPLAARSTSASPSGSAF